MNARCGFGAHRLGARQARKPTAAKRLTNAVRLISKLIAHTGRRLTEFTVLRKRSAISENDGSELFHPEEERSCLMFN